MRFPRTTAVAGALLAGVLAYSLQEVLAQGTSPAQGRPPAGGGGMNGGNELVDALKATKGCLGVESAFTQSRKMAIFAWFESKKAVLDWYYSDYHQTMMMGLQEAAAAAEKQGELPYSPGDEKEAELEEHEALEHVADDCGPVLCIATITPAMPGKQAVPGFPQPISQISIELYAPLPGGIAFNGRLAPDTFKVPHMIEMKGEESAPAQTPAAAGTAPIK